MECYVFTKSWLAKTHKITIFGTCWILRIFLTDNQTKIRFNIGHLGAAASEITILRLMSFKLWYRRLNIIRVNVIKDGKNTDNFDIRMRPTLLFLKLNLTFFLTFWMAPYFMVPINYSNISLRKVLLGVVVMVSR